MSLADQVRQAGVVGAGGAGFPTHVKFQSPAETIIANGAECEPLLHKDAAVMEHFARDLVTGVEQAMAALQAKEGVIAIKAKNKDAFAAVENALHGSPVRLHPLGDYYPAGDEYDLVHEVTGKLIPPQGIPLQVGVVVNNVETLLHVADALRGRPVTHKILTVAGAVARPVTLRVPLGTPWHDCLQAAGGVTVEEPVLCLGGLMMGSTTDDFSTPVTKTTAGAIVLPRSHRVVQRKLTPIQAQSAIGKSACDQCRYCTEFCPRYLLGYAVEPHLVMRSLSFTATGETVWNQFAALCCSCGLCTLYACPEELFPKEACDASRAALKKDGSAWSGPTTVKPHPMHDGRRVPIRSLIRKLHLEAFDRPAPFQSEPLQVQRLALPLKQHAGTPARPLVRAGDRVQAGQTIASVDPAHLGANLHAPATARVADVTATQILLECL